MQSYLVWTSLLTLSLLTVNQAESQTTAAPLTLITAERQALLPTVIIDGERMVALSDLATPFGLAFGSDQQTSRLAIIQGETVLVLTANDGIVSVGGRLVSLPTPPVERDGAWFVPIDFIGQALALIPNQRVELRRRSELVVVGDVLVPQVVARYNRDGSQSRLRIVITPTSEYDLELADNRLILTLEADALDLVVPEFVPDGKLTDLHQDEDRPRLTLDLGEDFGRYTASDNPALGGGTELIIDLHTAELANSANSSPSSDPESPAEASVTETNLPSLSILSAPPSIRAIAIDPGHGGEDTGTRGPGGALEKDITLSVARLLQGAIERQLGLRVVLTRTGDTTIALDERAAFANNNRADLFISLHVNASVRETATGAEVFHLSLNEYDEASPGSFGLSSQPISVVGGGSRSLDIVPWELAQLRFADQSARWAEILSDELSRRIPMSQRGLQQAPFRVLVGTNMPAALIEMGYISNPVQETQLSSNAFQSDVVQGLIRSIVRYREEVERGVQPPIRNLNSPAENSQTRSVVR